MIFSARAVEGHYRFEGGSVPGTLGMMVQVWKEPNLNKQLVEYLGISSTEDPYFVIFTKLKSGVILRSILKINDSTLEKAYKRIRSIIKDITYAIEKIDKENIENYESVFNAIDMSISNIKNFDFLKKLFDFCELFKKIRP